MDSSSKTVALSLIKDLYRKYAEELLLHCITEVELDWLMLESSTEHGIIVEGYISNIEVEVIVYDTFLVMTPKNSKDYAQLVRLVRIHLPRLFRITTIIRGGS